MCIKIFWNNYFQLAISANKRTHLKAWCNKLKVLMSWPWFCQHQIWKMLVPTGMLLFRFNKDLSAVWMLSKSPLFVPLFPEQMTRASTCPYWPRFPFSDPWPSLQGFLTLGTLSTLPISAMLLFQKSVSLSSSCFLHIWGLLPWGRPTGSPSLFLLRTYIHSALGTASLTAQSKRDGEGGGVATP